MTLETNDVLNISKETIAFQNGKFGLELENFIIDVRRNYATAQEFIDSKTSSRISEIIKKHTKMLILVIDDYKPTGINLGPLIILPQLANNHIFFKECIKPYFSKTVNEPFVKLVQVLKAKNGVNLKTSEVFGVFEYFQTVMVMDAAFIFSPLQTPAEVTAIILHETGHLFTYFEYVSRTVTTNQILASLYEDLIREDTTENRSDLIQSAAAALSYPGEISKDVLNETDARKIVINLMRTTHTKSETNSDKYEEASSEVLADQFAIRHGYGLALATSLAKISKDSIAQSKIARTAMYISETISLATILGIQSSIVGIGVSVAVGATVGLFSGIFAFMIVSLSSTVLNTTENRLYTYDPFPTRLKKIKEQILQATRQKELPKEQLVILVKQIDSVDALIKYSIDKNFLLNTISDFIRPFNKSPAANITLNRRLEELASNDLFVGAAKLKTLL